jgi:hypothetical protein
VGQEGGNDHGEARVFYSTVISELEGGKICRDTRYYAEPFEAPEWRARWVERMDPWAPGPAPPATLLRARVNRPASCPSAPWPGTGRCLARGPVAPAQKKERSRAGRTYQESEKVRKKAST